MTGRPNSLGKDPVECDGLSLATLNFYRTRCYSFFGTRNRWRHVRME